MLIRHTPDTFEKLHILGGMAGDDILSRPAPGGADDALHIGAAQSGSRRL